MNDRYGLVMLEYEKLRDESIQSLQGQQAILQRSIGSFGVLLGAALLLATQSPPVVLPLPLSFGIFGVAVPAFAGRAAPDGRRGFGIPGFLGVVLYMVRGLLRAANTAPFLGEIDPSSIGRFPKAIGPDQPDSAGQPSLERVVRDDERLTCGP